MGGSFSLQDGPSASVSALVILQKDVWPFKKPADLSCAGQHLDHLPVGAVVGGCDVAVNLQCSLVVDISQPVTLHRLVGGSSPQQRLHVERRKFERPERKQAEL